MVIVWFYEGSSDLAGLVPQICTYMTYVSLVQRRTNGMETAAALLLTLMAEIA